MDSSIQTIAADLFEKIDEIKINMKDQDYLELCSMLHKLHTCNVSQQSTTRQPSAPRAPVNHSIVRESQVPEVPLEQHKTVMCLKCFQTREYRSIGESIQCQCGHNFIVRETHVFIDKRCRAMTKRMTRCTANGSYGGYCHIHK